MAIMSVIRTQLHNCLSQLTRAKFIYVAYSGGIDSTALLHACKEICQQDSHQLRAIHVNHHIHADSAQWARHCVDQCKQIGVEISCIDVDIQPYKNLGVEGAARQARYDAFEKYLSPGDVLLTGHHADDQLETMLLQLFRGAGVHGLAGCASSREMGHSLLIRPFLNLTRATIKQYASEHQLVWKEDPSNCSIAHDRNYLRHQVIPRLHARWHQLQDTVVRAAQWQSEAATLLDQLADIDLQAGIDSLNRLDISQLRSLDEMRMKNLLRRWIRGHNCKVPTSQVLARIINEVIQGRKDNQACVTWADNTVRRYRQRLYLLAGVVNHDASWRCDWRLDQALVIPGKNFSLTRRDLEEFGVNLAGIDHLSVCFRQGGESMRPKGRGCRKTLKALFQEAGIEPWERDRTPLFYHNNQLILVWRHWIDEGY